MRIDAIEKEVSVSRKCTEDQPSAVVALSTTPQRVRMSHTNASDTLATWASVNPKYRCINSQDQEYKRRRLTSESQAALLPRGYPDGLLPADYVHLGCLPLDETIRNQLIYWGRELKRCQPKVRETSKQPPSHPWCPTCTHRPNSIQADAGR